jgi:hypothetical protein
MDQHVNPERGMMKQGAERTASYDTRRKPRTVGGTTWAGRRSVENTDVLLGRATSVEPWGGRDMGGGETDENGVLLCFYSWILRKKRLPHDRI